MTAKVSIRGGPNNNAVEVLENGQLSTVPSDFFHEVANGMVPKHRAVYKFGRAIVGTTFSPLAFGGVWQTVQPAAATTLRVKAGNVNDAVGGSGAQEITVHGLNEFGARQAVALPTAGTSAGAASSEKFIRVNRAFVSGSGTYATTAVGSHTANLVIENGAGGTDWLTIDSTGRPRGQTEIGCFAIPVNERAFINSISIFVEATRSSDVIMFQRGGILKAAAPYDALREVIAITGIVNSVEIHPRTPIGPFDALSDIIFLGKVGASTGPIIVDFEIILEEI